MHGTLRFALATLVVLSHLGRAGYFSVGASAVVVFYMLAGFVVMDLMAKHFSGRLLAFYAERLLRILPLYLAMLFLAGAFVFATGFASPDASLAKLLANVIVVPLNYFMFLDVSIVRDYALLPTAWSLGAELQAYAILPFLLRNQATKWIAGIGSLLVFSASAVGVIDPGIWGYRLLPGVIFIFLGGAAVCRSLRHEPDRFDSLFPGLAWMWLLVIGLVLTTHQWLKVDTGSVLLGYLIGLPILVHSSSTKIRLPYDGLLGRLSYGVFLIHLPASWMLEYIGVNPLRTVGILATMALSIVISAAVTATIEQWVWPTRKRLSKGANEAT